MGAEDFPYDHRKENQAAEPCQVPGCEQAIPEDDLEDAYCFGCGAYVCPAHEEPPYGGHGPMAHKDGEDPW